MSAPHLICMRRYARNVPWSQTVVDFACQYPKDHEGEHSWGPLKRADELAARPQATSVEDDLMEFLLAIENGELDPYLEAILTTAHERKRCLRGVRRFTLGGRN